MLCFVPPPRAKQSCSTLCPEGLHRRAGQSTRSPVARWAPVSLRLRLLAGQNQGWARRLWFKRRDVSFASFSRLL
eukprot:349818-Chlamydomonas_euryale.AAC.1